MPTISSLRSNPSLTPWTMLAMSERIRPCRARTVRWSELRPTVSTSRSIVTDRLPGTVWLSLPLGPSALTVWPSTATLTPCGTVMGFLPIRDMACAPLPHVREDFAAELLLAHGAVRHDTVRGGQDGDTHPAQDARDLVLVHIDAAPGLRHADQAGYDLLVARAVLQVDAQRPLLLVLDEAEVLDEALVLEDLGDPHLELGGRDVHLLVLGAARVADARQEVCDRVAHRHGRLPPYQLALITPGTSPLRASS